MNPRAPFELILRPDAADIDALDHVNNIVYVRWLQELASAHWSAVTTSEERASLAWVVVRHEIDYLGPARLGDVIVGRTFVSETKAATCLRESELVRAGDGRELVRAKTLWCAVDPASGKPRRVPPEIRDRFAR